MPAESYGRIKFGTNGGKGRKGEVSRQSNLSILMKKYSILKLSIAALALSVSARATAGPLRYEAVQGFASGASEPTGGVMQASTGELYGVAEEGGAYGGGTIYKVLPDGSGFETLVHFSGEGGPARGKAPQGVLVEWVDGDSNQYFYGLTRDGGLHGHGTAFRVSPDGTFETLQDFDPDSTHPVSRPEGTLCLSSNGNFYGTCSEGGNSDEGTFFQMTPDGTVSVLYLFNSSDPLNSGAFPRAGVVEGNTTGTFYGTTSTGGNSGEGTIFKIDSFGAITTLVHFTGETGAAVGSFPTVRMTRGSDGNFYGVTKFGGYVDEFWNDLGIVFKVTPAGVYTALAGFAYPIPNEHRGMWPESPLVEGSPGVFYGATSRGGLYDRGTAFKITSAGAITTLVDFDFFNDPKGAGPQGHLVKIAEDTIIGTTIGGGGPENEGTIYRISNTGALTTLVEITGRGVSNERSPSIPMSSLAEGVDGNFYGTTNEGGDTDQGTVYKVTPAGDVTTLVSFTGNGAGAKGSNPRAELLEGNDGNFYGTTESGGASDFGTVFKVTPGGGLTTLVEFTGTSGTAPGAYPRAGLVDGGDGYFYGTTYGGGSSSYGTIFRVSPAGLLNVLVEFTWDGAIKGSGPSGTMVKAADGHFYGTTEDGGSDGVGTAFRVDQVGTLTTLHEFTPFAAHPVGIMEGTDGIFYGTCRGSGFPLFGGSTAYGNIFKINAAGEYTTLVNFYGAEDFGAKGKHPLSGLTEGPDGLLYGTTSAGGGDDRGTLFQVEKYGFLTTIGEFTGADGEFPGEAPNGAPLILGSDGHLYGTTSYGGIIKSGKPAGHGQIFRLKFVEHRDDKPILEPDSDAGQPPATNQVWEDEASGIYDGLLRDSADGESVVGAVNKLVVSKPQVGSGNGGAVSGTIRLNGRSFKLRGVIDANGRLLLALNQRDGTVVYVDLQLMKTDSAGTETFRGTIEWNGVTSIVDLDRVIYHYKRNPAPPNLVGRYTMLMPSLPGSGQSSPGGDGWGLVTVNTSGSISVKGRLGDGTRFSEGAYLSGENETSLYRELYSSQPEKGRIGGKLTFRDVPGVSDFDGLMEWKKFEHAREKRYPEGFKVQIQALGSRYTAPESGGRVLVQLAEQEYNARAAIIDDVLNNGVGQVDLAVSWKSNNRIYHYGPEKMSATASAKNGSISGSYFNPDSRETTSFTGVAFQKQGIVGGVSLFPTNTGAVRIQPGTNLEYPGSEDAGLTTWIQYPDSTPRNPETSDQLWDQSVAGIYHGILDESDSVNGFIQNLKISTKASFTASIWIDFTRYSLKGKFNPDGEANVQIVRRGMTPIDVMLELRSADSLDDAYQVTGTVAIDGRSLDIDGQKRPVYSKLDRSPFESRYTIVMPAPQGVDDTLEPGGDGYGAISVNYKAVSKGSFYLADGWKVTFSGHVSRSGEWSVYSRLSSRRPRGYLSGKLTFRDVVGVSDVDGQLHWVKNPLASPINYPGGFDIVREIVGSGYTPPSKGVNAWSELIEDYHNAWLRLEGPDFSLLETLDLTELDRAVSWNSANKIKYYGPESISIRFNALNGTLTGRITDKPNGINQRIGAALFQKQGLVSGCYVAQGKSGRCWMEPR